MRKCEFEFDKTIGIHKIDSPFWFKPEHFNQMAQWAACMLEENLWANFNFYQMNKQK
jgi:hypothetical protein